MLLGKFVNAIFHVEYVYAYHDQDSRKHDFSFKNEHVIKRFYLIWKRQLIPIPKKSKIFPQKKLHIF